MEGSVLVEEGRLHYLRVGQGPALLMVHGLVGSSKNFDRNASVLGSTRTVYALDLLNMGASERVPGLDVSLEATADRLARTIDRLGLGLVDVVAHSHGGAVALMLAARHPAKVGKLVLFAPANPFCGVSRSLLAFYATAPGGWLARRIPVMPRFVKSLAHRRMYVDRSAVSEGALAGYLDSLDRAAVEHTLRIVRRWWKDMEALEARLDELAGRRILLIWGDQDPAVGLASGQRLADRLRARLVVLQGVGHLPFAERAEDSNRLIEEWLAD